MEVRDGSQKEFNLASNWGIIVGVLKNEESVVGNIDEE